MVKCLICGKEMNYLNNFHLRKHGLTEHGYLAIYPNAEICSTEVKEHKRTCHIGQVSWNIGLTKETDVRVKNYSENGNTTKELRRLQGLYQDPWNKNLTKETDKSGRLVDMASKISKALTGHTQSAETINKRKLSCGKGPDNKNWKPELHEIRLCSCGCGELTRPGNKFINGHNGKVQDRSHFGNANPISFEKQKRTMMEKYGVEFPFKSEEIKKRTRETNLRKYGIENPGILAVGKRDTKIEKLLSAELIKGVLLPFKKHIKIICCYPDMVFEKQKVAVFCDGDYWHGNPLKFPVLTKRQLLQKEKDNKHTLSLQEKGWCVFRFWETDIENSIQECVLKVTEQVLKYKEECKDAHDLERVNKIALQGYIGGTPAEQDNTEGSFSEMENPVETKRLVPSL